MPLFPGSVWRVSVSFGGPFCSPLVVGYRPIFAGAGASADAWLGEGLASADACSGVRLVAPTLLVRARLGASAGAPALPSDACSGVPALLVGV